LHTGFGGHCGLLPPAAAVEGHLRTSRAPAFFVGPEGTAAGGSTPATPAPPLPCPPTGAGGRGSTRARRPPRPAVPSSVVGTRPSPAGRPSLPARTAHPRAWAGSSRPARAPAGCRTGRPGASGMHCLQPPGPLRQHPAHLLARGSLLLGPGGQPRALHPLHDEEGVFGPGPHAPSHVAEFVGSNPISRSAGNARNPRGWPGVSASGARVSPGWRAARPVARAARAAPRSPRRRAHRRGLPSRDRGRA